MKTIQVFDKPMCCSTGICGPQVDPVLPRFAADLEWLKTRGVRVERFNLTQQAAAFTQNADVRELLKSQGMDCLPLVVVDGQVASRGQYPTRELLSQWSEVVPVREELPVLSVSRSGCCESGRC